MAKRFDIHEWQAKQKLAEQEDFTPDLEDDELKRGAVQQMMSTEKGLQKDDYKLVNSISNVADMYSYGEILDALESFYTKNDEQQSAEMARKHAKEFREFLGPDDQGEDDDEPVSSKFTEPLSELDITTPRGGSMSNSQIGSLDDIIDTKDLGKILNVINSPGGIIEGDKIRSVSAIIKLVNPSNILQRLFGVNLNIFSSERNNK